MFKKLLFLAFLWQIVGCKTLQVWDKGFPKSSRELKSDEEKKSEFNKFAIIEGNQNFVQLQNDKGTDTYYSFGSFSSVIKQVSPESSSKFEQYKNLKYYEYIVFSIFMVGIFLSPEYKSTRVAGNVLTALGISGIWAISFWQSGIINEIKDDYHNDLNKLIFDKNVYRQSNNDKAKYVGINLSFDL